MRNEHFIKLVLAGLLGCAQISNATVLLTDMPWNSYGGDYNAYTNPSMGQQFTTDNNSYRLDSVVLTLTDNWATRAGGFGVSIYTSTGAGPAANYGSKLGDLVAQGNFFNFLSGSPFDNPTDVTFNASGINLSANSSYWIKVSNPNSYGWLSVYGGPFPNFGVVDNGYAKAMANPFTATVNVTSVPEPSTGVLLTVALSSTALLIRRRRQA